jgi:hypothetical protein
MKSLIDCLKSAPFPIDYRLKIDHRDNTKGAYRALIYQSQIWAVGVPPGGSQGFWLISRVHMSAEMDHKNLETLGFDRTH